MPSQNSQQAGPPSDAPVYSVGQLNREARRLLEDHFAGIWVSGEISRFTHHSSGHMYFDLKDADASVSCAMFRGSQRSLRFKPAGGQQVLVKGKISIYEANGRYQIVVDHMEEAGEGLLRRQFEELKARLLQEGLFDEAHKQALPELPATIGVVTSPTGAALRDVLNILKRRYPLAKVIVYPARVQGEGAKEEIAAAVGLANERDECDVLIVGRGGGSLEDLWAFNEEIVARAIYASDIPVVSGVGHEIDFTIADLVADVRAPTPSGAAELITPDRNELQRNLRDTERRALLAVSRRLETLTTAQTNLEARLRRMHPGAVLNQMQQRVDELTRALVRSTVRHLNTDKSTTESLTRRLLQASPLARVTATSEDRARLQRQLQLAMQNRLDRSRQTLRGLAANLNAVSPLATLDRGYAILRPAGSSDILRTTDQVKTGDTIEAQLADGRIEATVSKTRKENKA